MHFASLNTNFLTQGAAALDPCQGIRPWTPPGALQVDLDPTRCFSLQAIPHGRFILLGISDILARYIFS